MIGLLTQVTPNHMHINKIISNGKRFIANEIIERPGMTSNTLQGFVDNGSGARGPEAETR